MPSATDTTKTTFQARIATINDLERLVHGIQQMAIESEGRVLDTNVVTKGATAVFETPSNGNYWLLDKQENDGSLSPVGSCMVTSEWSDWNNAPYWWLQSVYIAPEWRGKGCFGELYAQIEAEAIRQGIAEMRLYVETENASAIRSYDKNGFEAGHYHMMTKKLGKKA